MADSNQSTRVSISYVVVASLCFAFTPQLGTASPPNELQNSSTVDAHPPDSIKRVLENIDALTETIGIRRRTLYQSNGEALAQAHANQGDRETVDEILEVIPKDAESDPLPRTINGTAFQYAISGDPDNAERLLNRFGTSEFDVGRCYIGTVHIAYYYAHHGPREHAYRFLTKTEQLLKQARRYIDADFAGPWAPARVSQLATLYLMNGREDDAIRLLDELKADALRQSDNYWRNSMLEEVVYIQARVGQLNEALKVARGVKNPIDRTGYFSRIADALLEDHHVDEVDKLLLLDDNRLFKIGLHFKIAEYYVENKDINSGKKRLYTILQIVEDESKDDPSEAIAHLIDTMQLYAKLNDMKEAATITDRISEIGKEHSLYFQLGYAGAAASKIGLKKEGRWLIEAMKNSPNVDLEKLAYFQAEAGFCFDFMETAKSFRGNAREHAIGDYIECLACTVDDGAAPEADRLAEATSLTDRDTKRKLLFSRAVDTNIECGRPRVAIQLLNTCYGDVENWDSRELSPVVKSIYSTEGIDAAIKWAEELPTSLLQLRANLCLLHVLVTEQWDLLPALR